MVAPGQKEILGVLDFEGEQEADGFNALLPAVDIVPEEQIVGLEGQPAELEQPEQVEILTVDVPAYLEWRAQLEEDWLLEEDFAGLGA